MIKSKALLTSLALFAIFASTDARANLIVFEPDDFAVGTYVSTINPLVSLWNFRSDENTSHVPVFAPVFVSNCIGRHGECGSTTGTRVFGDAFGGIDWGGLGSDNGAGVTCFRALGQNSWNPACNGHSLDGDFNLMLMSFATPTDFVRISSGYAYQDEALMYGLDDAFNLVGSSTVTFHDRQCSLFEYCTSSVSLVSQSANIRYVLTAGWANGASLDNLQFSRPESMSVPEPEAFALFMAGLAGMALVGRRKRLVS
jgi:hypothetical protein